MKSDFIIALTQLAAERNLPREIVLSAIEAALVSAYRKDSITSGQNISVKLDPAEGEVSVYIVKTAVEEVEDPQLEMTLADARKIKPDAEIGDVIPTETLPHTAGRIAAQTAKQVVLQRLREAERELVYEEFGEKEGDHNRADHNHAGISRDLRTSARRRGAHRRRRAVHGVHGAWAGDDGDRPEFLRQYVFVADVVENSGTPGRHPYPAAESDRTHLGVRGRRGSARPDGRKRQANSRP